MLRHSGIFVVRWTGRDPVPELFEIGCWPGLQHRLLQIISLMKMGQHRWPIGRPILNFFCVYSVKWKIFSSFILSFHALQRRVPFARLVHAKSFQIPDYAYAMRMGIYTNYRVMQVSIYRDMSRSMSETMIDISDKETSHLFNRLLFHKDQNISHKELPQCGIHTRWKFQWIPVEFPLSGPL